MLLWHEANAVMLSSRPDLVSLFATPLCQGEVPTCLGITRASWPHSESAHALGTPRVSHIRQGRWSFTPSLAIIWQSIQESGADKRLCQSHGKHHVSADNTRMGEVKNNPQRKMHREAEGRSLPWRLLQEAPDLLWASCSSSPPAPPGALCRSKLVLGAPGAAGAHWLLPTGCLF